MEPKSAPPLLIAVSPYDMPLVNEVLRDEFTFVACHTFEEARNRLSPDLKLIICGVHFDRGRMFDLLRLVRSTPEVKDVPFIIGLGRDRGYTAAILSGIETAAKSLGATAFINMLDLNASMSREASHESIRGMIRRVLASGSMP